MCKILHFKATYNNEDNCSHIWNASSKYCISMVLGIEPRFYVCWVSVLPLRNMLDILVLKIFYDVKYIHAIISDNNSMKSLGKENQENQKVTY